jgi:uncharacterized protein YpmB
MIWGMCLMAVLIATVEGAMTFFVWRRMAEYLKDKEEAVAALTKHLFVRLLGRKPKD